MAQPNCPSPSPSPAWPEPRPPRLGLSEPDGRLHALIDGRTTACGRTAKPIRTDLLPGSLPLCPSCLALGWLARQLLAVRVARARITSPARRLVDRVVMQGR